MHELFLGIAFIAMVATPAMVATLGGKKESQPEPEEAPVRQQRVRQASAKPAVKAAAAQPAAQREAAEPTGHVIRPHSMLYTRMKPTAASFGTPTLPLHGRGMVGR